MEGRGEGGVEGGTLDAALYDAFPLTVVWAEAVLVALAGSLNVADKLKVLNSTVASALAEAIEAEALGDADTSAVPNVGVSAVAVAPGLCRKLVLAVEEGGELWLAPLPLADGEEVSLALEERLPLPLLLALAHACALAVNAALALPLPSTVAEEVERALAPRVAAPEEDRLALPSEGVRAVTDAPPLCREELVAGAEAQALKLHAPLPALDIDAAALALNDALPSPLLLAFAVTSALPVSAGLALLLPLLDAVNVPQSLLLRVLAPLRVLVAQALRVCVGRALLDPPPVADVLGEGEVSALRDTEGEAEVEADSDAEAVAEADDDAEAWGVEEADLLRAELPLGAKGEGETVGERALLREALAEAEELPDCVPCPLARALALAVLMCVTCVGDPLRVCVRVAGTDTVALGEEDWERLACALKEELPLGTGSTLTPVVEAVGEAGGEGLGEGEAEKGPLGETEARGELEAAAVLLVECAGEGEVVIGTEAVAAEEKDAVVLEVNPGVLLPTTPLGEAPVLNDAVGVLVEELLGMDKGLTALGDTVEVAAGDADCE